MRHDQVKIEGWYWWRESSLDEWSVRQILFRAGEWRGYCGEENLPTGIMGGEFVLITPPND